MIHVGDRNIPERKTRKIYKPTNFPSILGLHVNFLGVEPVVVVVMMMMLMMMMMMMMLMMMMMMMMLMMMLMVVVVVGNWNW